MINPEHLAVAPVAINALVWMIRGIVPKMDGRWIHGLVLVASTVLGGYWIHCGIPIDEASFQAIIVGAAAIGFREATRRPQKFQRRRATDP